MAAKASEDPRQQQGQIELLRDNALGSLSDLLIADRAGPGDADLARRQHQHETQPAGKLRPRADGAVQPRRRVSTPRTTSTPPRACSPGWNLRHRRARDRRPNALELRLQRRTTTRPPPRRSASRSTATAARRSRRARRRPACRTASISSTRWRCIRKQRAAWPAKLYGFFVSETVPADPAFIDQLATVYLQNGSQHQSRCCSRFCCRRNSPTRRRTSRATRGRWNSSCAR